MDIAIVASNKLKIASDTKKGTEVFLYSFLNQLPRLADNSFNFSVFCSGDSQIPLKIESIDASATASNENIAEEKHIIFELALISKAFSREDKFDLFHFNIGNGDIALPFARFINKPVLITMHYTVEEEYAKKYFNLFKDLKNVHFVSLSDYQRKLLPDINYAQTIYHGVDTNLFSFDEVGSDEIMWAGRAIPQKGLESVMEVSKRTDRKAKLFGIFKKEHEAWFENVLEEINKESKISFNAGLDRLQLISQYQKSRLFLFPVIYEEPFGLVLIEAMSCGTPVVAFARGSVPEVIKDGETGFIVNSSDDDIRGDFIIKKTGLDGLIEAVERIYSMPEDKYWEMRRKSRQHVEENFTIEKMTKNYLELYRKIVNP